MCGIAGFLSSEGLDLARLQTMTRSLRHRGPDDEGFRVWDGRPGLGPGSAIGRVGLAQQRLAILDLSPAGRNPLANDDGSLWITYNGEVFNFREIRRDLEAAGFRFHTETDTEVVLKAYERWGRACLDRFVGMFAFAIWDSRRGRLFAARDRLGIKPFAYLWNGAEFAFASEMRALELHPSFAGELDRTALAQFLRFQYVPSPAAIWRGLGKLPPGHWLEVGDGRIRIERWWDPVSLALGADPVSGTDAEARFEAALSEAVRYRMVSDVPLGAFLSGGIDSSTVVALMQEHSTGPVSTFCIGFEDAARDESAWARAVARHLGTDHHERVCTTAEALALVPVLARQYDEPFGDSSAIPTMLVSRFARERVTVALSGDGGDELFLGYNRYSAYRRLRPLLGTPGPVRRAVAALVAGLPGRGARRAASILRSSVGADRYLPFIETLDRDRAAALAGASGPDPVLYADARARLGENRPDAAAIRDLVSYLPEDILTKVDRASMAFSLEARVPLLDHRLVELALALPVRERARGARRKIPLRRALSRRLPPELVDRPKSGFEVPLASWLSGGLRESVREALSPASVASAGLVEPRAAARILGADPAAGNGDPSLVWSLYVLHLWSREVRERVERGSGRRPRADAAVMPA